MIRGKRGRPSKPAASRKRNNLTFRVTDDLHRKLSNAALHAGRSISEEVETRLERSFAIHDHLAAVRQELGGSSAYGVLMVVGHAMQAAGTCGLVLRRRAPDDAATAWSHDAFAYDQAFRAAVAVLDALRPPGDSTPPVLRDPGGSVGLSVSELSTVAATLGDKAAHAVLTAVAYPEQTSLDDLGAIGAQVRAIMSAPAGESP
jgi:hypothetical protein